jgi:hypothetical protein
MSPQSQQPARLITQEITASSCHQIVEKAQTKGSEDPVQRTGEWGLQVILVVCNHVCLDNKEAGS